MKSTQVENGEYEGVRTNELDAASRENIELKSGSSNLYLFSCHQQHYQSRMEKMSEVQ